MRTSAIAACSGEIAETSPESALPKVAQCRSRLKRQYLLLDSGHALTMSYSFSMTTFDVSTILRPVDDTEPTSRSDRNTIAASMLEWHRRGQDGARFTNDADQCWRDASGLGGIYLVHGS